MESDSSYAQKIRGIDPQRKESPIYAAQNASQNTPSLTQHIPPYPLSHSTTTRTTSRRASFSGSQTPLYSEFWTNFNRNDPGLQFRPTPLNPANPFPRSSEPTPATPAYSPQIRSNIPQRDAEVQDPFTSSETDHQSSYNSFFAQLRPPVPPVPPPKPQSYDTFFNTLQSETASFSPSETTLFNSSLPPPYTSTPAPTRSFGNNSTNIDFAKFGQFSSSDDFTMGFHPPTRPQSPTKRKKESDPDSPSNLERKRRREMAEEISSLSVEDKLDKVFDLFKSLGWSLGEFMHHLFAHKDVHRSQRHGNIVQRYLSGRNFFNVAEILEAWFTSPDGAGNDLESEMFTLTTPYTELAHVRSVLTAFSAQIVKKKLIQDIRIAVQKSGGLHAPISRKKESADPSHPDSGVGFAELGGALMANIRHIIEQTQGLFYQYMVALASPDIASRQGVVSLRRNRPPELAAINAISMITFCRNYHARLLPLAHGVLYLASHVPIDIIDINCRLGAMPSLETIKATLRGISDQKAAKIRRMGRDTAVVVKDGKNMIKANIIIFDNSQHFRRQRERRIGRENTMVIGISATFFQMLVPPAACDPLDRRRRIALNLRGTVTVESLLTLIDFPHLRTIGFLQFLSALAAYTPELEFLKSEIHLRYRTRCQKYQLDLDHSDINTLACSGKNEAIIPELKDALLDFENQIGQTETDYDPKLWWAGGDGMSYNNMLLVQKYLQNHTESAFQRFELMIPALQVWHTLWTDLCRIYETHWGAPLNDNPATLGNSAKKIGRPAPGNLSKVDYYPAAELLALVHDTRMLDCWRIHFKCDDLRAYFKTLAESKQLPSYEDLEPIAKQLYDSYTSMKAQKEALFDAREGSSAWSDKVPLGAPWVPVTIDESSAALAQKKGRKKKKSDTEATKRTPNLALSPQAFYGDHVMSDSAYFMRDASLSREAAAAVAEGDVGRVYEVMKAMLFNFAGSGHSRYMGYLLETTCHIELESGPELAAASLAFTICNPSRKRGGFQACDMFQERMNRELEPILQRKDTDYGSNHVRNLWSRNLKDIYDLKAEMRQSVGLAKRSGRHKAPHEKPEVKILLRHYNDTELNLRRPGRTFGEERVEDNFTAGIKKLRGGSLTQWARRTSRDRGVHVAAPEGEVSDGEDSDSDESDDDSKCLK